MEEWLPGGAVVLQDLRTNSTPCEAIASRLQATAIIKNAAIKGIKFVHALRIAWYLPGQSSALRTLGELAGQPQRWQWRWPPAAELRWTGRFQRTAESLTHCLQWWKIMLLYCSSRIGAVFVTIHHQFAQHGFQSSMGNGKGSNSNAKTHSERVQGKIIKKPGLYNTKVHTGHLIPKSISRGTSPPGHQPRLGCGSVPF